MIKFFKGTPDSGYPIRARVFEESSQVAVNLAMLPVGRFYIFDDEKIRRIVKFANWSGTYPYPLRVILYVVLHRLMI